MAVTRARRMGRVELLRSVYAVPRWSGRYTAVRRCHLSRFFCCQQRDLFRQIVTLEPNARVMPFEQRAVENSFQRAAFVGENSDVIIVIANRQNFHAVGTPRDFGSQKERDMIGITRETDVGVSFSIHRFIDRATKGRCLGPCFAYEQTFPVYLRSVTFTFEMVRLQENCIWKHVVHPWFVVFRAMVEEVENEKQS